MIFWSDESVLQLDHGDDFNSRYLLEIIDLCTFLKRVNFEICKLHPNNMKYWAPLHGF